ncbi:protein sidekick-1 [Crotalus adamanteus]|uniref:Protein sidekick-1 n=1 Tax=Crotalus adamanteus TaxID=8729 RepID=A0AAW1ATI7_CROAD
MEITEFSREYKYVIPSLKKSDGGFYQCIVRNRMGALLQRKSEVQVAYMGSFQHGNQWTTVPEGQAAVLNVPHIPSYPKPQVTWFRDGHKIIPSSRITITLENQLVILATLPTDAGNYYAQAVNEKNGENKTSPLIYLNVTSLNVLLINVLNLIDLQNKLLARQMLGLIRNKRHNLKLGFATLLIGGAISGFAVRKE